MQNHVRRGYIIDEVQTTQRIMAFCRKNNDEKKVYSSFIHDYIRLINELSRAAKVVSSL